MDEGWEKDDTWASEPDLAADRMAERRAFRAERMKSPTFGNLRDFLSALPLVIGMFCLSGYLDYYSVTTRPGVTGWIGGALFSFIAAYLGMLIVRATIRLIRTGTTQKS